jgi:hypothetical protein
MQDNFAIENQENIPPLVPIPPGVNIRNMMEQIEAQLTDCEGLADDLELGLEERIEYLNTPENMALMVAFCRDQIALQNGNIQTLRHNIHLLQRILSTNPNVNRTLRYNPHDATILLDHYIECFERVLECYQIALQFLQP